MVAGTMAATRPAAAMTSLIDFMSTHGRQRHGAHTSPGEAISRQIGTGALSRQAYVAGRRLESVTHFSRLYKAVIDVPADDYDSELSFWEGALGQPMSPLPHPEYHGTQLHSQDFCLLTQRLG